MHKQWTAVWSSINIQGFPGDNGGLWHQWKFPLLNGIYYIKFTIKLCALLQKQDILEFAITKKLGNTLALLIIDSNMMADRNVWKTSTYDDKIAVLVVTRQYNLPLSL